MDIYAHRGTSLLRPENTATAFDFGIEHHADVLETDVRLARGGTVMVTHDATLERTTDGAGRVREHDYRALRSLDAGYRFRTPENRPFRGQGIRLLSLAELFERYPTIRINIDIKDADPAAADAVAALIARHDVQQRVNVGSFHAPVLHRFRDIAPGVETAASQGEVAWLYFQRAAVDPAHRSGRIHPSCARLQIPVGYRGLPLARPAFLDRLRRAELEAVYWTINDTATMQRLIGLGVDGIVTDRCDLANSLRMAGSRQEARIGIEQRVKGTFVGTADER